MAQRTVDGRSRVDPTPFGLAKDLEITYLANQAHRQQHSERTCFWGSVMSGDVSADPAERLEKKLVDGRDYADGVVFRLNKAVAWCWWGNVVCAGIAAARGFVAEMLETKGRSVIEPWMIDVFDLIGGALEVVRRKTSRGSKSNLFYMHRDDVDHLLRRMRYEMPQPPSADHIALRSRKYRGTKLA